MCFDFVSPDISSGLSNYVSSLSNPGSAIFSSSVISSYSSKITRRKRRKRNPTSTSSKTVTTAHIVDLPVFTEIPLNHHSEVQRSACMLLSVAYPQWPNPLALNIDVSRIFQKSANAFGGLPTSPDTFKGTLVSRNVYRPTALQCSARAFKSQSSPIGSPKYDRKYGCRTIWRENMTPKSGFLCLVL